MILIKTILIAFCILVFSENIMCQRSIELINANAIEFDKKIVSAKRLIGNVALRDNNTIMYCDSAYLYENNSADAFGKIKITAGDSVTIYGDFLSYDGNTKIAILKKNVKLIDKNIILTTSQLFYESLLHTASYHDGATIINNENTLTSVHGEYFTHIKEFAFKENVVLFNSKYTITCDTLLYSSNTKIAKFLGPTNIKGKNDLIYCENGFYNTLKDVAQFKKNAYVINNNQKLKGDSLFFDKQLGIGKGFRNVEILDTTQKISVTGDYCYTNDKIKLTFVTGNALLRQYGKKDTLFIHADTLKSEKDSVYRIINAYHRVKIFKSDIQGQCDSLSFTYEDTVIRMFKAPILWSYKNQLTSDKIEFKFYKGEMKNLKLINSAFIISQEDSTKFNQIKGKIMFGFFKENKLYKIRVEGNGQTIYFGKDKKKYIGVNKADCSDLLIYLKENEIEKVTFLNKPDATLYPLKDLLPNELVLKNFEWRSNERPLSYKDVFNWNELK